jgi:lysophospholipase L1-like esterase
MNTLDKVYDLTIDIKNIDVKYNSYAKFFDDDRETSVIRIKLLNDKTPIDLEGCTVEAEFILANNTYHDETCKIINSSEGVVELQLCQKCLVKGENIVRLSILKDNEISNTPVITYEVRKGLYSDNPSFNDDPLTPILSQMLLDIKVTKVNQIELQERYEKSLPKIEGKIKEVESLINRVDTAIASGTQDLEVKEARANKKGIVYAKLGDRLNEVDSQLEHKANLNAVFSMANMGQDVKEAMTGGSVAVVGRNTILKENVVDKQITPSKTSFIDVENSVNLFNKNSGEIQLGGYLDASGEFKEYTSYFVGHKIDVTEGQTYTVSYAEPSWGGFYNSEGTFISKIGTPSGVLSPFTFTVPEGACYMRLNGIISSMNTYMIVLGDSLPSQYVAFYKNFTLNESVKIEDVAKLQEEYEYNIPLLQNRFVDSLNLFDKTSPEIILGSFITSASGDMSTSTSTAISPYMPVKPNEVYSFKFYPDIYGSNKNYAFYDRNKNPIEDVLNCVLDEETNVLTITVPNIDTIKYVRVNCSENDLDSFMFVKGETYPSEYISGNATLRSNIDLNDLQKDTVGKIVKGILDTTSINSVLVNKVITFNGDSICAGAGYTGGYGKIIADKYNMTYENVAVSGGTITAETYSASGSARHWISRTISKMRDDADYIVLEGGVNDASLSIPLGEITSDYISTLDDTTYCGAFESMLKQALGKYPSKKIGYIMVHKMEKNFDSRYEDNHYQMSKKICEKWGVPYLDLNIECPPLNYIPSLKATYTKDGDGWHPNELGYKKYYVDKIVHWLESL